MCGIFGIIGNIERFKETRAYEILRHRGPDAHGSWFDNHVLFQHTRLKIIDLSEQSNQPFINHPDYALVFNGEIYNFKELKPLLEYDFTFKTKSDTEVLYYYLIKNSMNKMEDLNGQFSFSFYDRVRKKVFFSRDRFGKKPLYYYAGNDFFIFASEQKAIYSIIKPVIDDKKLDEYFLYKYIAGTGTLVKGICELCPGTSLEYDIVTKDFRIKKWFSIPDIRNKSTSFLNEAIENEIIKSVKYRMISDVPIGVQLSGGVDSSIITKIVKDNSNDVVKTYSIGFPGTLHDESDYAKQISSILNTDHVAIPFTMKDFLDLWEISTYHNDEPINHPHTIPIFKLTQMAGKEVKVLISGEGADEVFLGYRHHNDTIHGKLNGQKLIEYYRFNSLKSLNKMLRPQLINESHFDGERMKILNQEGSDIYELQTHLNTLLNRIDKMSMANAVEVRTPFIDPAVAEIGLAEAVKNLNCNNSRKIPLINIYEKYFNTGLSKREKIGFRVPYNEWLSNPGFNDFVCDHIKLLSNDDIFCDSYIDNIVNIISGKDFSEDDIRESWVLVNFSLWKRAFNI